MVSSTAILIDVTNANSNLSIVLWFATRPTRHLRGFSEDQTGTSSFEEVPQTVTAKAIVLFPPSSDNVPCLDIQATLLHFHSTAFSKEMLLEVFYISDAYAS